MIFPNFPKYTETGSPVIPELPAPPLGGGENGNGKRGEFWRLYFVIAAG